MRRIKIGGTALRILGVLTLVLAGTNAGAAQVDQLFTESDRWLAAQRKSQSRVDQLANQTRDLSTEYRTVLREIDGLQAYNRQLQRQVDLQVKELTTIENSISQATTVDRQIFPLLLRMVGALEQFISLDLPFNAKERAQRVEFIKDAADRVDVTVPEKFRQVLEAYKVELVFGRTIEAYTDLIELDGQEMEVDLLRVGRIGLYYQTLDGTGTGMWDQKAEEWIKLGSEYRNSVRQAIKVARKLTAPDLFTLPVRTPEDL